MYCMIHGNVASCRYPDYEFVGDSEFAKTAGLSSRYTDTSLLGIIMDIHFLSKTNYLVCTFSSQVGHSFLCTVSSFLVHCVINPRVLWHHSSCVVSSDLILYSVIISPCVCHGVIIPRVLCHHSSCGVIICP